MKNGIGTFLIGTILAIAGIAAASAADAPDPVVGTWTLNLAKSKFNPGPAPKSQTRTYTADADGISLAFKGVTADGSPVFGESTFKYDNKAYPFSGSPDYDAISLQRVNGSTVKSIMMKSGKKVGSTTRTISAHGKVLTLATKATDVNGKPYENVGVYDKQ
jgi:hypothetical protein